MLTGLMHDRLGARALRHVVRWITTLVFVAGAVSQAAQECAHHDPVQSGHAAHRRGAPAPGHVHGEQLGPSQSDPSTPPCSCLGTCHIPPEIPLANGRAAGSAPRPERVVRALPPAALAPLRQAAVFFAFARPPPPSA